MIPLLLTTADWYGWFWFWPLVPLVWLLVVFLLARFVFGAAAAAHAEPPLPPATRERFSPSATHGARSTSMSTGNGSATSRRVDSR